MKFPRPKRAPILRICLKRAPRSPPHVPVNQKAPLAEFEKVVAAVFRISPTETVNRMD